MKKNVMQGLDKTASLMPNTRNVICNKATERPTHSNIAASEGSYLCRRCGLALFRGNSQFSASCGWPSFDDNIVSTISEVPDNDGVRTEICCMRCDGHLGHVFTGEYFTPKNKRFCVNACAIDFVADSAVVDTNEAILAGGCFWGVEYYMKQLPGVLMVESGYSGGRIDNPSYQQICDGNSGHMEVVRVIFDVAKTTYRDVLKQFFETHDPTQQNGQGPDIGEQYQSAVFYHNDEQRAIADALIMELASYGYQVVTSVRAADIFWPAEDYHQNYYAKHHKTPYCHRFVKRFR